MQGENPAEEYIGLDDLPNGEKGGFIHKIKSFLDGKYFIPILMALAVITAFFLGRISVLQGKRVPVRVLNNPSTNPLILQQEEDAPEQTTNVSVSAKDLKNTASVGANNIVTEIVVGSKNGAKYHYPWCAGAKQISEQNLIIFDSISEARSKGYTPAANCKGLK